MLGAIDVPLKIMNAIDGELVGEIPEDMAGVILGGSGETYLSRDEADYPWLEQVKMYIQKVINSDIPVLGVCFGMQLIAKMNGARVVKEEGKGECGGYKIMLTENGKLDELMSAVPEQYTAHLGHQEIVTDVPDIFVHLAEGEVVKWQAMRLKGKRVWGVLFHPELNEVRMKERVNMYRNYAANPEDVDATLATCTTTPYSQKILEQFCTLTLDKTK